MKTRPQILVVGALALFTSLSAFAGVPPVITQQPADQTVPIGSPVTFTVVATFTGTPNWYAWYANGVRVPNATNSTYTIPSVQASDTGIYSVTVCNADGQIPSRSAYLNCLPSAAWSQSDISDTGIVSGGAWNDVNGVFTVVGAGNKLNVAKDRLHFVHQTMSGDGSIVARITSQTGANAAGFSGVMIRETTATGSRHMAADVSETGVLTSQVRKSTGGSTTTKTSISVSLPYWVKLTRASNVITAFSSADGVSWTPFSTNTVTMASSVQFGMFVNSGNHYQPYAYLFEAGDGATAHFDNITAVP